MQIKKIDQPLFNLTVGEWIEIQKSLFDELHSNRGKGSKESNKPKDLLTIDEACDYLDMKKSTLYSMNCRRQIPFTKVLGKVYYRKSALDQWLATGDRKTQAQLNSEIWEGR